MTNAETTSFRIDGFDDGAVFRLARPAKLNAITRPILLGLAQCIDQLENCGRRWLVVTADGDRAFCAGTDLNELQSMSAADRMNKTMMARDLFVRLSRSPLVSVAAINGLAFGGGLELAMACLFRVAVMQARFALPEIKLGLLPAYAGTQFLPTLVGKARANDLMLTGRAIDTEQALAMGLIDRIADRTALLDHAIALAREVTRFSPQAIAGIRRCVAAAGSTVDDAGLQVEDETVRQVFDSDDAREGVAAFLGKRDPKFRGR